MCLVDMHSNLKATSDVDEVVHIQMQCSVRFRRLKLATLVELKHISAQCYFFFLRTNV